MSATFTRDMVVEKHLGTVRLALTLVASLTRSGQRGPRVTIRGQDRSAKEATHSTLSQARAARKALRGRGPLPEEILPSGLGRTHETRAPGMSQPPCRMEDVLLTKEG